MPDDDERPEPACGRCMFSGPHPAVGVLVCRRFPPAYDSHATDRWPMVQPESWCGEFLDHDMRGLAGGAFVVELHPETDG